MSIKPPKKSKTHKPKKPQSDLEMVHQNIFLAKTPQQKKMWQDVLKALEGKK
jgi:hypothetical protein